MAGRKEFREGKTKGNTKPLPKGPRPNIGPPPPQHPEPACLNASDKNLKAGCCRLCLMLWYNCLCPHEED